jgi:hypothetical protein
MKSPVIGLFVIIAHSDVRRGIAEDAPSGDDYFFI